MILVVLLGVVWLVAGLILSTVGLWLAGSYFLAGILFWSFILLKENAGVARVLFVVALVAGIGVCLWNGVLRDQRQIVACAESPSGRFLGWMIPPPTVAPPIAVLSEPARFDRDANSLLESSRRLAVASTTIRASRAVRSWLIRNYPAVDAEALGKATDDLETYLKSSSLGSPEAVEKRLPELSAVIDKFRQDYGRPNADFRALRSSFDSQIKDLPFEEAALRMDRVEQLTAGLLTQHIQIKTAVAVAFDENSRQLRYDERITISSSLIPVTGWDASMLAVPLPSGYRREFRLAQNEQLVAAKGALPSPLTNVLLIHRTIDESPVRPGCTLGNTSLAVKGVNRLQVQWPHPNPAIVEVSVRLDSASGPTQDVPVRVELKREDALAEIQMPANSVVYSKWTLDPSREAGDHLRPPKDDPAQANLKWFREGNVVWIETLGGWLDTSLIRGPLMSIRQYLFAENAFTASLAGLASTVLAFATGAAKKKDA